MTHKIKQNQNSTTKHLINKLIQTKFARKILKRKIPQRIENHGNTNENQKYLSIVNTVAPSMVGQESCIFLAYISKLAVKADIGWTQKSYFFFYVSFNEFK